MYILIQRWLCTPGLYAIGPPHQTASSAHDVHFPYQIIEECLQKLLIFYNNYVLCIRLPFP